MAASALRGRMISPGGRHASGFTLLEIMVVVVIIGIIATIATLSVGIAGRDQGIGKEIRRLQDLLALVGEQAVLQGREYGLTFFAHEYRFTAYDYSAGRWEPVLDDPVLAPRKLPADAVVDLYVDGRQVHVAALPPQERGDQDAEQPPGDKAGDAQRTARPKTGRDALMPQVFIMSSGDVTPFEVHLRPDIGRPGITLQVADSGEARLVNDER